MTFEWKVYLSVTVVALAAVSVGSVLLGRQPRIIDYRNVPWTSLPGMARAIGAALLSADQARDARLSPLRQDNATGRREVARMHRKEVGLALPTARRIDREMRRRLNLNGRGWFEEPTATSLFLLADDMEKNLRIRLGQVEGCSDEA